MNLNKKYTLVHSTPEHFILHDGQAHFHVAKKGLGKDLISKIEGFAEGGKVESEEDKIGKAVTSNVDPDKAKEFHPFEEGGKIKQYNEEPEPSPTPQQTVDPDKLKQFNLGVRRESKYTGGEIDKNEDSNQEEKAQELNTPDEMAEQAKGYNKLMKETKEKLQKFPDGGEVQPEVNLTEEDINPDSKLNITQNPGFIQSEKSPEEQAIESAQGLSNVTGTPMPETSAAGQTVPPAQQVSFNPPSAAPAASSAPQESDKFKTPQNLAEAEQLQNKATGDTAEAQAKAATQTAETMKAFYDQEKKRQRLVNIHLDKLDKDNDTLFKDASTNKIDPNRYWANTSTPGKISVALGLILGGLGSGMTGQPNQAAHFIQNAIAQDIEAQKLDQSTKMNAYKLGLERYKDVQSASAFATVQANTLVSAQLQQIAANSQNPAIIATAQKEIANNYVKMAPLKMELAQRSLAMQLGSGGTANINVEGLAPEYRERAVELGAGQIALAKTKEGAALVGKDFTHYNNILNMFNQMDSLMKVEGRQFNPMGAYAGKAAALRNSIILEMNQVHDLNRLNENEFNSYKATVPGPGDFFQNRAKAKLDEIKNTIMTHKDNLAKNYLSNYKGTPQIQTGPPVTNKQFNKIGR